MCRLQERTLSHSSLYSRTLSHTALYPYPSTACTLFWIQTVMTFSVKCIHRLIQVHVIGFSYSTSLIHNTNDKEEIKKNNNITWCVFFYTQIPHIREFSLCCPGYSAYRTVSHSMLASSLCGDELDARYVILEFDSYEWSLQHLDGGALLS